MNVIWAISIEDDKEQSVFFNELRNLVLNAPEKNILFLMYYRSLSWHKALFLKYYRGNWSYRAVSFQWKHDRILNEFYEETHHHKFETLNLYLSAHCWKNEIYTMGSGKRPFTTEELSHWAQRHQVHWNLVIFDCCYMSTIYNIENLYPSADYMIALETSQGYVGFQMPNLMSLFVESNTRKLGIKIAKMFVKQESPIEKLSWAADVALIDLKAGQELVAWVRENQDKLVKNDKTRVEVCDTMKCKEEYDLFDLWIAVPIKKRTEEFQRVFEKTRIFYGQNRMMRENKKLSSRLHGISIGKDLDF